MNLIDFKTFCEQAPQLGFFKPEQSYCFKTIESYPHLFFTLFFKSFERLNGQAISSITQADGSAVQANLQQSFLGQTAWYWLGSLDADGREKSRTRRKEMLSLIATYQGPHTVLAHVTDVTAQELDAVAKSCCTIIGLPEKIDESMVEPLMALLGIKLAPARMKLLGEVFYQAGLVPLDTFCQMLTYLELINPRGAVQAEEFLLGLVEPELSFIELSKHFFNRDAQAFFYLWDQLGAQYPETYWIVYWSEQMWRAYHVTQYLRQNKIVEAKKMSYRLPFAFAGYLWKKSSLDELSNGSRFLYRADCALKTGSTFDSLELFFLNYFSRTFESNAS